MKSLTPGMSRMLSGYKEGKELGIIFTETSGGIAEGRSLQIDGEVQTSFASCSYLGLDKEPRMQQAAISAIENFGTYFSTSRSYLQLGDYTQLEKNLEKIFGAPTVVAASTTLAHLSVLPIFVGSKDAVVIDYQAHNSLQDAVLLLKGRGTHREIVPHNDMIALKERIAKLVELYEEVWYVFDGVYSIYGDVAPFEEIQNLLDEFPTLHLYCDDAHGMGWAGKNGRGYALEHMPMHDRMILTTSLNKAVASGGGAIVLPNEETKEMVRNFGKTLIFSGPLPPAGLASALACSEILLSDELPVLQQNLLNNCDLFRKEATRNGLNLIDLSDSPIFFIGIGNMATLYYVAKELRIRFNIFVTPTTYPAVPINKGGLRITITQNHTADEIVRLVEGICVLYKEGLEKQGVSPAEISTLFIGQAEYGVTG